MRPSVTAATHEQGMACLSCGLAGFTPDDHFPQAPGLWDEPCPACHKRTVWVTEPRPREAQKIDADAAQATNIHDHHGVPSDPRHFRHDHAGKGWHTHPAYRSSEVPP